DLYPLSLPDALPILPDRPNGRSPRGLVDTPRTPRGVLRGAPVRRDAADAADWSQRADRASQSPRAGRALRAGPIPDTAGSLRVRSEEHTSELQSPCK